MMFRISLKLYFKNKILLILTIAAAAGYTGYLVYQGIFWRRVVTPDLGGYYTFPIEHVLEVSWLILVFFLFVSYEYFSQIPRRYMEEALDATRKTSLSAFGYQIAVMELLSVAVTLVSAVFVYACMAVAGMERAQYLLLLFVALLLNVFLMSNVGIFIGLALATNKKRLSAYVLMLVFSLLSCPLGEMGNAIVGTFVNYTGINIYRITPLFWLYDPIVFGHVAEETFGKLSVLPYRFCAMFFWVFLSSAIFLLRACRKKRGKTVFLSGGCMIAGLICLAVVLTPSSRLIFDNENMEENTMRDGEYYYRLYEKHYPEDAEWEEWDGGVKVLPDEPLEPFRVTAYDMTFSAINQLAGEVTMTVDRGDLDEYGFTLYYGYRVKSVEDQDGNKMDFEQDGDYIKVRRGANQVEKITMRYKGYSSAYYTNVQGIDLPGWFAYYPRAGYHVLADEHGEMLLNQLEEAAQFRVQFKTNRKIYSNLENRGENCFTGVSNGATFVSGFYEEREIDGITVVMPYLDSEANHAEIQRRIKEDTAALKQLLDGMEYPCDQIIVTSYPYASLRGPALFHDHVTVDTFYWGFSEEQMAFIEAQLFHPEKVKNMSFSTFRTYQMFMEE